MWVSVKELLSDVRLWLRKPRCVPQSIVASSTSSQARRLGNAV